MKIFLRLLFLSVFLILFLSFFSSTIKADDNICDKDPKDLNESQLSTCIDELSKSMSQSKTATQGVQKQIDGIKERVKVIENDLVLKQKNIDDSYKNLAKLEEILNRTIRDYYIKSYYNSPLVAFLSASSASEITQLLAYQKAATDQDKVIITNIAISILDLETKKKNLEAEQANLAVVKEKLDKVVAEAQAYQATLSSKIASLSARQQEILAAKIGTFQTSVGDVPLADDSASRPDYNPGFSPAFAAFSFGAPHFKGMSQYGAFGRAKQGQDAEQILRVYYGDGIEIKKDYSTDITINVDGYGGYNIEDYVKRIYEMPGSWGDEGGTEALKAQAVAARSYALARTNNGSGSICATESCQVFKTEPKGGNWENAVNATRGWVLIANGQPLSSWYASTSGGYQESYSYNGYNTPGFWDTPSGRSGWTSQAYEKVAGSPWFYKGWYKTRSGVTCGRSHPWLTSEEFADITNAAIVYQAGGDISGIFPEDVQSCFGGSDSPWSKSRLREEADKHGGGLSSITNVSVVYSDAGVTAKVIVDGKEIDGQKFYKAFNLRAPGAINLKSGLFNIEKK